VKLKVGGALRKSWSRRQPVRPGGYGSARANAAGGSRAAAQSGHVSKQLYWPFTGEKQFQADDLKLKLSGKMTDYTLSFRTAVKGQDVPPATITLDAKGNEQQINLDKLTVAALEGKTELKALLDWQQAISWRGELTLTASTPPKRCRTGRRSWMA
jgi:translocation and assembly module TamB